jgi:3-oxoacyl-[acyl-carrier protein] reductase
LFLNFYQIHSNHKEYTLEYGRMLYFGAKFFTMNLNLHGKRALVCGSSQGIGKAIAIELAELGAQVTLMARNEDKLKQVLAELKGEGHAYLVADFSDSTAVEKIIQAHAATNLYHILVNNTGGPPAGPVFKATPQEFLNAFHAHLLCNHIITTAVMQGMKDASYGRIINIISTSVKQPLKGLGVSNTIRAAVGNWAKTLSAELAPFGITVNNVLPGATKTVRLEGIIQNKANATQHAIDDIENEMLAEIPAGRFGKPEEIAAAAAFLATPAAAYINGTNIVVDGGRTGNL